MINCNKFLKFKGENYDYKELHELHYKGYSHYNSGDVLNTATGEVIDISRIKEFFMYAIKDLKKVLKENIPELSKDKTNYVASYVMNKQFKGLMDALYLKIENNTIKDEELIVYWEIKSNGLKVEDIKNVWYPKNYIKINQDFLPEINGLTDSEKGSIFNMMYYITYNTKEDKTVFTRDILSNILNIKDINNIRKYMKKLEDNEILVRLNKNSKGNISLMFNPLFVLKGAEKELNYNILEYFPKSFSKIISLDVVKLIELKNKLNTITVEAKEECIE